MKFLNWLFRGNFNLFQVIVIVTTVSVINEVIRIHTKACYNEDHHNCSYLIISPETNVETNRVPVSLDEKIIELEKKVENQRMCYPVYVPTKEEQELMRLKIERYYKAVTNNLVDACTSVDSEL